jgi:hypothetical protein
METKDIIKNLNFLHPGEEIRIEDFTKHEPRYTCKTLQVGIGKDSITVGAIKKKTGRNGQCFRCQLLGHTDQFCTPMFRCVNCGESHGTKLCTIQYILGMCLLKRDLNLWR